MAHLQAAALQKLRGLSIHHEQSEANQFVKLAVVQATDGGLQSWPGIQSASRGLGYNAFHFASAPDLLSRCVVP